MPKAAVLTDTDLIPANITPKAATPQRGETPAKAKVVETVPLQLRLPRAVVKQIKTAAIEHEQTISDFMQACFQSSMQTSKKLKTAE